MLRIRGPTIIPLSASSADLTAINIWGNNPSVKGHNDIHITPGSIIRFEQNIEIEVGDDSVLDLLYFV